MKITQTKTKREPRDFFGLFKALGLFALFFGVFVFLEVSGFGERAYKDVVLHSILLFVVCFLSFYVSYFAYEASSRNKNPIIFMIALAFYAFGFSFLIHAISIPDFAVFNEAIFDVTEHYGLFLGSLILVFSLFSIRESKDILFKNHAKIFVAFAASTLLGFFALMLFPVLTKNLVAIVDIVTAATGLLFLLSIIFFVQQYLRYKKSLLLYLVSGLAIVLNTAIIPFFYQEWNLLWWYFHFVFLVGFMVIWMGLIINQRKEVGFFNVFGEEEPVYRKMTTKLFLLFLLISLLPVIIFGVTSIRSTQTNLEKDVQNKLLLLAEAKEGQIFVYMDFIETLVLDFSQDKFIANSIKSENYSENGLNEYLAKKKLLNVDIEGIFVTDKNDVIVASTDPEDLGLDESSEIYIKEGKIAVFSKDTYNNKHSQLINPLVVSAPILEEGTDDFLGVLVAVFDVKTIENILSGEFQLSRGAISGKQGKDETIEIYLVNSQNEIFVYSNLDHKSQVDSKTRIEVNTPPVTLCSSEKGEMTGEYTNYKGESVVGASMCFADKGWVLISEVGAEEAFATISKMQFRLGMTAVFLSIVIILISFISSNKFVGPIRKLGEGLSSAAVGDLSRLTEIKTGDELEQIGAAFNKIATDAKDIGKIKDYFEEAKKRDDALLLSIGDGMIASDKDGKIILMNKFAEKILGWKLDDFIGKKACDEIQIEDEKGNLFTPERHPIQTTLESKKRATSICHFTKRSGEKFPVAVTTSPVILNRRVEGAIMVFRDITKEREIDKAKTEFVSLASHELRAPISIVSLYLEMVLKGDSVGKLTLKQRGYLNEVQKANKRLLNLINALLNISRIESGVLASDPELIKITDVIDEVVGELEKSFEEKKINVKKEYEKSLPAVNFDSKFVRIIFQNLISNAMKYTPKEGDLKVSVAKQQFNFLIKVTDTGYGIPREQQAKIFGKMFRADNILGKNIEGTGLGLYITKMIVGQLKGKIWFESKEGVGTTFYVTLPLSGMKYKKGSKGLVEKSYNI